MLVTSFVAGMIVLLAVQRMALAPALISAGVGAVLGAATELFTPSKYDTVSVPVVVVVVLLLLSLL